MLTLPADVLYLVCEELSKNDDFNTLFNCALAGKSLAGSSLLWLYRIHNRLVFSSDSTDTEIHETETYETRDAARKRNILMWALQWKSMIRSSLGCTAYPYCLYIRTLDLRALADLLDDPYFRDTAFDGFFINDMSQFLSAQETPMKQKMRGAMKRAYVRLDIPQVLGRVGESITKYISECAHQNRASTTVEELTGQMSSDALLTWTNRLSNLKTLTLWDGSILNGQIGAAIAAGCFRFDDLTFFSLGPDSDHSLASFFGALNHNSFRSFSALSAGAIGPETLSSLNGHSKSLKKLSLNGLRSEGIKNLSLLRGCDALDFLQIADAEGIINIEATENDVFLEVVAWLGRCKSLRELSLKNIVSGSAILSHIFANNEIKLRELRLHNYPLHSNQNFHKALALQTSLESLTLEGDPEGGWRDDIDTLVSSLTQLKNLKTLKLLVISDYFRSSEVIALASELSNLEFLEFSGYDVTDSIWHSMTNLHNLKALNIQALTSFSSDGILAYISMLRDTNEGLQLSVLSQKTEDPFTELEQQIIKDAIAVKVNGNFDFTLYREADSEDEVFSD